MTWLSVIAGFLSGLIGGLGLGGGGVLLVYLTAFTDTAQQKAGGINLLFFLPVGLVAVIVYALKKQIKWKTVVKMWGLGGIGVVLGSTLALVVDTDVMSKIFAAGLIIFGTMQLLPSGVFKRKNDKNSGSFR